MADDAEEVEKDEEEEVEVSETPPKNKKILLGGGAIGLIAAASMAAMMAVPSVQEKPPLAGPFRAPLFEEEFNCNIHVPGKTRFLQMRPEVFYYAYERSYIDDRAQDELYGPSVYNEVFRVATSKDLDAIYGEIGESTFMEELRDALDPVLFPVHIGNTTLPWDEDEDSGLRAGLSSDKNTFRGRFHDHVLQVNAPAGTLAIDGGPEATFEAGDANVKVITVDGATLYVDTAALDPEFVGEISVGVRGQIRRILPVGLVVQ